MPHLPEARDFDNLSDRECVRALNHCDVIVCELIRIILGLVRPLTDHGVRVLERTQWPERISEKLQNEICVRVKTDRDEKKKRQRRDGIER